MEISIKQPIFFGRMFGNHEMLWGHSMYKNQWRGGFLITVQP